MTEAEKRAIGARLPSAIERLRSCASPSGAVSRRVFVLEADRLGLTTDEQQRGFRSGLAAFGIHVEPARRGPADALRVPETDGETGADLPLTTPSGPPVTSPVPGPAATEQVRRLGQARSMLARYVDADGRVGRLAHDGVVRLHGLNAAEARELTETFPIARGPGTPPVSDGMVERPDGGAATTAESTATGVPMGSPAGPISAPAASEDADTRLSEAVRAARIVLDRDRWRRNPAHILLEADEEVGLAVLLRGGAGPLGRDVPQEEIAGLPRGGERWCAHECLVTHNLRLVWKIAQGYQGRGLDIEDLVQHGNIGLLRAVRKFDLTQGYKFSTYATSWIKQSITRAISNEGTLIRLPVHLHEKVVKVAAAERKLLGEGRTGSLENVAYICGLSFAEVEKLRRISRPTDSLDRIIGDDTALGDLIMGPCQQPGPSTILLRKEFFADLRHVLEHFAERERHVLVRRTGLDGDEPDTLEAIGAVFGVTRERIRQIESKVKERCRAELARHGLTPTGH